MVMMGEVTFAFSFALLSLFLLLLSLCFLRGCNRNVCSHWCRCDQPARKLIISQRSSCHLFYSLCSTQTRQYVKQWTISELQCPQYSLSFLFCCPFTVSLSLSLLFVMYLLDGSAAVSPLPQNRVQCPPKTESTSQEPLNLSSRDRPRSPLQKANGRIPGSTLQLH